MDRHIRILAHYHTISPLSAFSLTHISPFQGLSLCILVPCQIFESSITSTALTTSSVRPHEAAAYSKSSLPPPTEMSRPRNIFPLFEDGDIEIILPRKPNNCLVLHTVILALRSTYFKVSLSERWSIQSNERATEGEIMWKYKLLFRDENDDSLRVPLLVKGLRSDPLPHTYYGSIKAARSRSCNRNIMRCLYRLSMI